MTEEYTWTEKYMGDWQIRFGVSQFLVCEGPNSTVELGRTIFKMLQNGELQTWMLLS